MFKVKRITSFAMQLDGLPSQIGSNIEEELN